MLPHKFSLGHKMSKYIGMALSRAHETFSQMFFWFPVGFQFAAGQEEEIYYQCVFFSPNNWDFNSRV